jgi:hypothetical protein
MTSPVVVALFADVACPFAYVAHDRWRRLRDEFRGRLTIDHKSLALEYINRSRRRKIRPWPKRRCWPPPNRDSRTRIGGRRRALGR